MQLINWIIIASYIAAPIPQPLTRKGAALIGGTAVTATLIGLAAMNPASRNVVSNLASNTQKTTLSAGDYIGTKIGLVAPKSAPVVPEAAIPAVQKSYMPDFKDIVKKSQVAFKDVKNSAEQFRETLYIIKKASDYMHGAKAKGTV